MKKILFLVTFVMTLVSFYASAQKNIASVPVNAVVVDTISIDDSDAWWGWLEANPQDTIVGNNGVKVFLGPDGRVKRTISAPSVATSDQPLATPANVKKAAKEGNDIVVTTTTGEKIVFQQTTTSDLTTAEKRELLDGGGYAFDPRERTIDGTLRKRVYLFATGGGLFNTGPESGFNPLATVGVGVEKRRLLLDVDAFYTTSRFTKSAEAKGRYDVLGVDVEVGYKLLNDVRDKNYLAVMAGSGYAYQRTDADKATASSKNYGLTLQASLRGVLSLQRNVSLVGQVGYRQMPSVNHSQDGTWEVQKWTSGGVYAQVGFLYRFNKK